MSWARAIASGLAVVLVAFLLLVWLPSLLLTGRVEVLFAVNANLLGAHASRHLRVTVATVEFTVALLAMAWGLRRMQARGWI